MDFMFIFIYICLDIYLPNSCFWNLSFWQKSVLFILLLEIVSDGILFIIGILLLLEAILCFAFSLFYISISYGFIYVFGQLFIFILFMKR